MAPSRVLPLTARVLRPETSPSSCVLPVTCKALPEPVTVPRVWMVEPLRVAELVRATGPL